MSQNEFKQNVCKFEYNNFIIYRTELSKTKFYNNVFLGEKSFTSFVDEIFESGPEFKEPYFVRTINEKFKVYYSLNKKIVLKQESILKPNFMKGVKLSFNENNHFISFDIEAYKDTNKEFIPYGCGWYDGSNSNMYYVTDFESPVEMIAKAFTDIANYINSGKNYSKKHVVYAHNLGHFDGLYIIEALHSIGACDPLIKDRKIVQVDFSVNCKYVGRKGGEKEKLELNYMIHINLYLLV